MPLLVSNSDPYAASVSTQAVVAASSALPALPPLKPFALTLIHYDPSHPLSIPLTLLSLTPIFLFVSYLTLAVFTRRLTVALLALGQLGNEALSLVLKRLWKGHRPYRGAGEVGDGWGMPSSHAQAAGFLVAWGVCFAMTRRKRYAQHPPQPQPPRRGGAQPQAKQTRSKPPQPSKRPQQSKQSDQQQQSNQSDQQQQSNQSNRSNQSRQPQPSRPPQQSRQPQRGDGTLEHVQQVEQVRAWRARVYLFGLVLWSVLVSYSRYHLYYHTPLQIIYGYLVGLLAGLLYYATTEFAPMFYPQSIAGQTRAAIEHVWEGLGGVGGWELGGAYGGWGEGHVFLKSEHRLVSQDKVEDEDGDKDEDKDRDNGVKKGTHKDKDKVA